MSNLFDNWLDALHEGSNAISDAAKNLAPRPPAGYIPRRADMPKGNTPLESAINAGFGGLGIAFSPLTAVGRTVGDPVATYGARAGLPPELAGGLATIADFAAQGLAMPGAQSARLSKAANNALTNLRQAGATSMAPSFNFGPLTDAATRIYNNGGRFALDRLQRALDEVPNLATRFDPEAVLHTFQPWQNRAAYMVIHPRDFEKYAAPIDHIGSIYYPRTTEGLPDRQSPLNYSEYLDHLIGLQTHGTPYSSIPYLNIGRSPEGLYVLGHEGRHRNRAFDALGDSASLVEIKPAGSIDASLPKESQEEYFHALQQQLGTAPKIIPQGTDRPSIPLPSLFANGGLA